MKRKGDFTSMYVTGRQFWPLDPKPEDIDIRDIACSLSKQCRWGGHVRSFYSVAQHCVLVSEHCRRRPVEGFLHDAAEAYLVDVPTPIKKNLFQYYEIERGLLGAIGEHFGVFLKDLPEEVHVQDAKALATEQRDLRRKLDFWKPPAKAWREEIVAWSPKKAERMYLARAKELGLCQKKSA